MKRLFTLFATVLLTATLWAQSPERISYQAIIRNSSNQLVTNTQVGMQISIIQGAATNPSVYLETQTPTTNANGLLSIEIGAGTSSDDFSSIDWSNGPYFIKTQIDPAGGINYSITATSQLLSVPYALHAKTAETVTGGIAESDPIFGASVAGSITGTDTTYWNNKLDSYTESDPVFGASVAGGITSADTTNWSNKQDQLVAGTNISIVGNTISATGGNASSGATYSVGDFAQGGIVFWVDEIGQHGLVCAKTDQDGGSGIRWYAGTFGVTRATGDGPYAGELNTAIIIAVQAAIGDDGDDYAAQICNDLKITEGGKTYGDWYLPSGEELFMMYNNMKIINATAIANGGSSFASDYYWTSKEHNSSGAFRQPFGGGYNVLDGKDNKNRVRAVRAF